MKLNYRITIEKFIKDNQNSNGFDEEVWDEEFYPCWADVKCVNGSEYIEAKAENSENIVTFTVRYCNKLKEILLPGMTKSYRVKYNGYYYDIVYASDFKMNHKFIDLKTQLIS